MRTLGEIQAGQTVGRYEFLVPIAQGGMAAVWAARLKGTRGFSKTVAVKTMLPSISDDPQFEQMFLDEAQLCSRIRHPNVVEILDLGEQDDVLYLVMEWVDGEALSTLRRAAGKASGFPRPIAVKIVADACTGLHAAHELKDENGEPIGLVHRDISPQNILITFDGVVKIVDFGVAKAAGRSAEETNTGQIKGKPPYMSPEQALGKDIDRRTDVFALGIILYQLTTGKHPFRGESDIVTLQNIVSDRPITPPRAYDPEYPRSLEAVVMKALERDVDERYQSAAELEAALDRVFPPTVPRVRADDVGKFVTGLLGARGDERRAALREAIRVADERAAGDDASFGGRGSLTDLQGIVSSPTLHSGLSELSSPTAAIPMPPLRESGSADVRPSAPSGLGGSSPLTPYGTQAPSTPPAASGRSRAPLIAVIGLAAAALGVGAVLFLRAGPSAAPQAEAVPAAPAAAPAAPSPAEPVASAPAEPAPEPAAEGESAIDPGQLALERQRAGESAGAAPRPAPSAAKPAGPQAPTAAKPDAKEPKPGEKEPAAKPSRPPGGGFVPPPVTDPGF
ncbi:MAG: serine/threonine-protein kinase [Sorangiineae bacterium]|nr:serine/threonine-protein kinase [Polyangiaceae bacterium]MEB2324305.1 serine/threonine-protein kinase [Sorangiineae bacterium]